MKAISGASWVARRHRQARFGVSSRLSSRPSPVRQRDRQPPIATQAVLPACRDGLTPAMTAPAGQPLRRVASHEARPSHQWPAEGWRREADAKQRSDRQGRCVHASTPLGPDASLVFAAAHSSP